MSAYPWGPKDRKRVFCKPTTSCSHRERSNRGSCVAGRSQGVPPPCQHPSLKSPVQIVNCHVFLGGAFITDDIIHIDIAAIWLSSGRISMGSVNG